MEAMRHELRSELVAAALVLAIIVATVALVKYAYSEEKLLCHVEPLSAEWHYRTKIPPKPELKCWYDGPRMLSREKLYWAEAPGVPHLIWQEEHRWRWVDPSGWTHQE